MSIFSYQGCCYIAIDMHNQGLPLSFHAMNWIIGVVVELGSTQLAEYVFVEMSKRRWGWWCHAKLAIRGSSDNPLIGLYEEGTHDVVDILNCVVHHPNINAAVELLRQGITELDVEPYDEDQGTGELRYVQVGKMQKFYNSLECLFHRKKVFSPYFPSFNSTKNKVTNKMPRDIHLLLHISAVALIE